MPTHSPIPYLRITWLAPDGKTRRSWAREVRSLPTTRIFKLVGLDGEDLDPSEMLATANGDIVMVEQARMNLKYAELEVIK